MDKQSLTKAYLFNQDEEFFIGKFQIPLLKN